MILNNEHIIFNREGEPIATNKTTAAQNKAEREKTIFYVENTPKKYSDMMTKEFLKGNGSNYKDV